MWFSKPFLLSWHSIIRSSLKWYKKMKDNSMLCFEKMEVKYHDRRSKANFVWVKYKDYLQESILDVGSDECYLKQYLPNGVKYWGIGLGGHPDQKVNLEKDRIPFSDNAFYCVLCLDVLEHIENIHEVFDDLCRVSRKYVIISLPNAWSDFYNMLRHGNYSQTSPLKFYGLPVEPPEDRHKWFFSFEEAKKFIEYRAIKNGMSVLRMDWHQKTNYISILKVFLLQQVLHKDVRADNLAKGTIWAVLEKGAPVQSSRI